MSQNNANAFEDDDSFAPSDDFLDEAQAPPRAPDPFADADSVERRLLGEDTGSTAGDARFEEPGQRPFGARLAQANSELDGPDAFGDSAGFSDDFGDSAGGYEAAPRGGAQSHAHAVSAGSGSGLVGEVEAAGESQTLDTQPVPRIAIHAFCESPDTGQLVHRAGTDRRLSKTHVNVELGGLSAAIERFHDETTPELLIIETGMRGAELFHQLDELASVCDPDTKVVIIGATNDITLYRELMTPLNLIKTVSDLFCDPDAPFSGRTLAFIGAKGGVGSSTVAHNVSWQLTEQLRSDAVLVDLDLSFGTAGLDFNQDPAQTIAEALAQPDRLDEALLERLLVRCTERLSLFSAPATLDSDWDFNPDAFEMVLDKVRRQAPFIMLDLPHSWSPWVRQTLLSADQVVVTVTPDLACLRNAKNLFDLVRTARPNDEPPKVVVNMAGCPKKPDIPLKDFSEALGAAPVLVLPFEPALFGKAANNGQMIAEVDPKSKAADGFAHLASVMTGRAGGAASGGRKSKSLFKMFSKG
jgi:pilus assembly protein CpaE